jgi:hypothetical protein
MTYAAKREKRCVRVLRSEAVKASTVTLDGIVLSFVKIIHSMLITLILSFDMCVTTRQIILGWGN